MITRLIKKLWLISKVDNMVWKMFLKKFLRNNFKKKIEREWTTFHPICVQKHEILERVDGKLDINRLLGVYNLIKLFFQGKVQRKIFGKCVIWVSNHFPFFYIYPRKSLKITDLFILSILVVGESRKSPKKMF